MAGPGVRVVFVPPMAGGATSKGVKVSIDATDQVMQEYVRALLAGGDYGQYLAEDVVLTIPTTDIRVTGRSATVDFIDHLHSVAFEADPEMTKMLAGEDAAAAEFVFKGRHVGEFSGVAATGRDVRLPYSVIYDVPDGRISALRIYMSVTDLMAQLV